MFPDTTRPRLFALAPGVDFPAALLGGIMERMAGTAPQDMAKVTLIVNTARMRRRVTELFVAETNGFLPRIRLVTDLGRDVGQTHIPPAMPPLRRRLQLTQAIDRLLLAEPNIAPRASLFDLVDSLATLMEELHGEGVDPAALSALDVSGHAAHWRRTQQFLKIIADFVAADTMPDVDARQRVIVQQLAAAWQENPMTPPVILAGSTGSRGTTALLMQAIARLPQGAVVLPGFDADQPAEVWRSLDTADTAEDHPQYRFYALLRMMNLSPSDVPSWRTGQLAPNPQRNRLISLALRPAPVTDQWMRDGRFLDGLDHATKDMTLIEAASPRAEALAISLILREAAERGQKAALITPDRGLSRMVTASLDRWGIVPDDSAGRPLALSPPGRFMRQVVALAGNRPTSAALLALLKHPLTSSGAGRGDHLRWTRLLERYIRDKAQPFPTTAFLTDWAAAQPDPGIQPWVRWLCTAVGDVAAIGARGLTAHLDWHRTLGETLAQGMTGDGTGGLWDALAGAGVRQVMQSLADEADHAGTLSPADYTALFNAVLNAAEPVRDTLLAHPDIMIWGTLEARVQGADLVILGGLNEGVWPGTPAADPWLNRNMRRQAGLLLPDRQIGLSAHDFQQAVGVHTVVLSRARRNAESETVASRWLNRLTNLLQGLTDAGGPELLQAMRERGSRWLDLATLLDQPSAPVAPANRPSPRPPVGVRPAELPVTDIAKLIRDPYSIYAKRILRLRPMPPLRPTADRLLKGRVLHSALETFARTSLPHNAQARIALLLDIMEHTLEAGVAWPAARALWLAKLERAAGFLMAEEERRGGRPVLLEEQGRMILPDLGFTLTARPDRIDVLPDGRAFLIDYKGGTPPTARQQKAFDKQLLLSAVMAAAGVFGDRVPREVAGIAYIGLGASPKVEAPDITDEVLTEALRGLQRLIGRYSDRQTGYTARRALFLSGDHADYDHLSRFGEWNTGDPSAPETVGRAE